MSRAFEAIYLPESDGLQQLRLEDEIDDTLAVAGARLETSPALRELVMETLISPYAWPERDPIHPETAMRVCRAFIRLAQQANADLHSVREVTR